MRLNLLAFGLGVVVESLQYLSVLAGVDRQHSAVQKGTVLFSDCLVLVLRVDVFEYFFGGEWVSMEVVALDPQPGSEVVFVI